MPRKKKEPVKSPGQVKGSNKNLFEDSGVYRKVSTKGTLTINGKEINIDNVVEPKERVTPPRPQQKRKRYKCVKCNKSKLKYPSEVSTKGSTLNIRGFICDGCIGS